MRTRRNPGPSTVSPGPPSTRRGSLLTIAALALMLAAPGTASPAGASHPSTVTWASLGSIRPLVVQPAGWGSPIAAQPTNARAAWCSPTGIEYSSATGLQLLPVTQIGALLKARHLSWVPPASAPICEVVALDPRHHGTIYAGFQATANGEIPPSYEVAVVTTDLGRTWRLIPPPHGYAPDEFSGFVERTTGVDAMYSHGYFFPPKPYTSSVFHVSTSSDGGRTWSSAALTCPTAGPCLTFGPQVPQGACGMSEWQQSILVASASSHGPAVPWQPAGGISTIDQCGSQQLVAARGGIDVLLDGLRSFPLHYTTDGMRWTAVTLPKIEGELVGGGFGTNGQLLTITAGGALVAVTGRPNNAAQSLSLLEPGATSWCTAKATLPAGSRQDPVSAVQSSSTRLVVAFASPVRLVGRSRASALAIPYSELVCRP